MRLESNAVYDDGEAERLHRVADHRQYDFADQPVDAFYGAQEGSRKSMDAYVHRSSRNKPEERLEVEDGLLKLVARFYARIRPALFAWLRPLEVAKEILLGYKLFEDGPPASKNMPWLGMAWGRFVAAAQHVDQDATLGMLIDVDGRSLFTAPSRVRFGGTGPP